MKVLPQDQGDFLRLKAFLESVPATDGAQSRVRAELLSKLRRYEMDAASTDAGPGAANGAAHLSGVSRVRRAAGDAGSASPAS